MTEAELRSWARRTLKKYGDDAIAIGHRPPVKEQELLGFMYALIDKAFGRAESGAGRDLRAKVKALGGSFPKVP